MIPDTLVLGIITFLVILGPLVILHELGHFFAAKATGTKVVEFGFGFPPRVAGLWTGRTHIEVTRQTEFRGFSSLDELARGEELYVIVEAEEDEDPAGASPQSNASRPRQALSIERKSRQNALASDAGQDGGEGTEILTGKLKELGPGRLVISEMVWSFNLLPLGGFVKMVGEEDPGAKGSLASKSRPARIMVMVAGVAVNAVLPIILFTGVQMMPQERVVGDVTVASVYPGSPADEAGLTAGDRILTVDGRDIQDVADLHQSITVKLGERSTWVVQPGIPDPSPAPGGPPYQYEEDQTKTVTVTPRWRVPVRDIVRDASDPEQQISLAEARVLDPGAGISNTLTVVEEAEDTTREISLADARELSSGAQIGDTLRVVAQVTDPSSQISLSDAQRHDSALGIRTQLQDGAVGVRIAMHSARTVSDSKSLPSAFIGSFGQIKDLALLTQKSVTGMLADSNNPQLSGPAVTGPIGIGQVTGELATAEAQLADKINAFAMLAATLSLSLAVINILPVPGLDGGRLMFVLIEFARGGKRIPPEKEAIINLAGIVLLLSLVALVSIQDIMRIVRGESLF
ncbi:MAG: site-2 protease family protein [Chloroflexota bacterium]